MLSEFLRLIAILATVTALVFAVAANLPVPM